MITRWSLAAAVAVIAGLSAAPVDGRCAIRRRGGRRAGGRDPAQADDRSDQRALEDILPDKLTYGHSDGRVQNRAELIDALMTKKSSFSAITLSDQTVSIVGDLAVVRRQFAADAISGGKAVQPRIRILQVWQKQDGKWRLLVRQAH